MNRQSINKKMLYYFAFNNEETLTGDNLATSFGFARLSLYNEYTSISEIEKEFIYSYFYNRIGEYGEFLKHDFRERLSYILLIFYNDLKNYPLLMKRIIMKIKTLDNKEQLSDFVDDFLLGEKPHKNLSSHYIKKTCTVYRSIILEIIPQKEIIYYKFINEIINQMSYLNSYHKK